MRQKSEIFQGTESLTDFVDRVNRKAGTFTWSKSYLTVKNTLIIF